MISIKSCEINLRRKLYLIIVIYVQAYTNKLLLNMDIVIGYKYPNFSRF